MKHVPNRIRALSTALCFALPGTVSANCDALQPLILIHDAYRAVISAPVDQQARGARHLIRNVPTYSAAYFASVFQSLKLETDHVRFETLMLDGYILAAQTTDGTTRSLDDMTTHESNVSWLMEEIARTGCVSDAQQEQRGGPLYDSPATLNALDSAIATLTDTISIPQIDWRIIVGVLGAVLMAMGGYAVYTSRPVRIARIERLPREQIALAVKATHADAANSVIILDLSLGGAKVEWENPPQKGEAIMLELPMGPKESSIVWSNAFFAGVMFDALLTDDEFDALLEINGSMTRSQLTSVM